MFAFDPEDEDEEDRYWLWRFMIDQNEQGKGYGQAALREIIRYFKKNGADRLYLSTEPENERGLHVYHKAGFREDGTISDGEAVLMRMLKGPNKLIKPPRWVMSRPSTSNRSSTTSMRSANQWWPSATEASSASMFTHRPRERS